MEKLIIGSHVSFNKQTQLLGSLEEALHYGSNTFMFYTGAPQNTNRANIDLEITALAHRAMKEEGVDFSNVVVHAPYIINLANPEHFDFAVRFLKEEIRRVEMLGMTKLVLHPGSHVGQGPEIGIQNIIRALNTAIDNETKVTVCIETMAGKGTECGKTFEEIKTILDGMNYKDKVKVCFDTCHVFDAGYDLHDLDTVLHTFDKVIGLSEIAVLHINDSKNSLSSHKDRHENIGLGEIGFETLLKIINHPKLKDVPKILETPYVTKDDTSKDKVYPPYKLEIEMIKKKTNNPHLIEDIRSTYKKD
ncbi:MAG: deoxyribonuclease IV [Bacilli bacterium]|nr:deoxyribonuclease IV [Bacilli bacterium]